MYVITDHMAIRHVSRSGPDKLLALLSHSGLKRSGFHSQVLASPAEKNG